MTERNQASSEGAETATLDTTREERRRRWRLASYLVSAATTVASLAVMLGAAQDKLDGMPAGPDAYQFTHLHEVTGEPVLWSRCPLTWSLDVGDGPSDTAATVAEALALIAGAGGLRFERVERDANIAIAVVPVDTLEGRETRGGQVLGEAGMVTLSDDYGTTIAYLSEVRLSAEALASLPAGFEQYESRGGLVVHEVLHALGMGHVNHRGSIMHPHPLESPFGFSPGDRVALEHIGDVACSD